MMKCIVVKRTANGFSARTLGVRTLVSYDHALGLVENYRAAARAHMRKLEWTGGLDHCFAEGVSYNNDHIYTPIHKNNTMVIYGADLKTRKVAKLQDDKGRAQFGLPPAKDPERPAGEE